jgi:ketosteroid isomerase-like protein
MAMSYVLKTGILLLVCMGFCQAQEFSDPDLQSLVEAERAFSLMAKEKNTRDAFLAFLSDDAVTSVPGQGPRQGKQYLEEQTPNESWLYWYPVYTDIAASGDFGFNTGPWEFRQKRTDENPLAFGQFVSIWKKNAKGEWRVAIDIGIGHPASNNKPLLTTSAVNLKLLKQRTRGGKKELFKTEQRFLQDFEQKGNAAYKKLLSDEARFYRPDKAPYMAKSEVQQILNDQQPKVSYTFVDGDVAASGDLAYVYGKASIELARNGVTKTRQCSYMRFWKKEDGKNWKIVLDLISN